MSLFADKIEQLLTQYDERRGFFHFLFRDPPSIRALRKLNLADKNNSFKVYQCFVNKVPEIRQASAYLVYREIRIHISKSRPLDDTINVLNFLIKENLTTQNISNFIGLILKVEDIQLSFLDYLKKSQLLTQKNLDEIIKQGNRKCGSILTILNSLSNSPNFGPLSQELLNLLNLSSYNGLLNLATVLLSNPQGDFINLASLVQLLQLPADNFFHSQNAMAIVWSRTPFHLLTQALFDQLITLSQQQNSQQLIQQYVNQLTRENHEVAIFNDGQSTHRASVHQSVSDSASKLFNLYGLMIEGNRLQDTLQMIHDHIMQLPESSTKNIAAKNAVKRIINLTFTDPGSGLTIPQLLALSFLEVHDKTKRIGDLSDAREQFVEGLYEIQRGYNLAENGHDRGGPDRPICASGTFNKLIEKLDGIHPDVEVLHITSANASLKLSIVVREVALDYLLSLAQPQTNEGFRRFTQLMEQIGQDECVDIIWDQIKPKITDRMYDEFGTLYTGKTDPQLKDLIESGQYLKLENLSRFQEQLVASSGYQHYCSQILRSRANFFSHLSATDPDFNGSQQSLDMSRKFK